MNISPTAAAASPTDAVSRILQATVERQMETAEKLLQAKLQMDVVQIGGVGEDTASLEAGLQQVGEVSTTGDVDVYA